MNTAGYGLQTKTNQPNKKKISVGLGDRWQSGLLLSTRPVSSTEGSPKHVQVQSWRPPSPLGWLRYPQDCRAEVISYTWTLAQNQWPNRLTHTRPPRHCLSQSCAQMSIISSSIWQLNFNDHVKTLEKKVNAPWCQWLMYPRSRVEQSPGMDPGSSWSFHGYLLVPSKKERSLGKARTGSLSKTLGFTHWVLEIHLDRVPSTSFFPLLKTKTMLFFSWGLYKL